MPLFSLDVQKSLGSEFWTNRYILELGGMTTSHPAITTIIACERSMINAPCELVSWRLSTITPGDDLFFVQPVNLPGLRAGTLAQMAPLFNVARVDFAVGFGRPSRKYMRGFLWNADSTDAGDLSTAVVGYVNENYADPIAALAEYVDVDGETIISGQCYGRVGMRQLRRGSRRRTEPIIPVA